MKALLLKDLLCLKKQFKLLLFIIIFFIVISIAFKDALMLLMFAIILSTTIIITAINNDEISGWDQFANTLPITRADIVKSKYILSVFLLLSIMVIVLPIVFLSNLVSKSLPYSGFMSILCISISASLFMTSILLPIYIKFGSQKGRLILFTFIFLPIFSMGFIVEKIGKLTNTFSIETLYSLSYTTPIFALIILIISHIISVKVYEAKEF